MALSKQSMASTRTLRSSGFSTKENVESPAFSVSKRHRSSGSVDGASKQNCGVSDSASTRQSRKSRSNCDGETGDSSRLRQPLSGIQNFASGASFMIQARKSRTERRLAKALNRNLGNISKLPVPPQEGVRNSVLPRAETLLSQAQSSQASFSPLRTLSTVDNDLAVLNEGDYVEILSPRSSDTVRVSTEVSPSPDGIDASAVAEHQGNFSRESCRKLSHSPEAPSSPEDNDVSCAFEVTPGRRASSRLATGALRTPEHLVSALGEGVSPRNGEAATEGKVRVYERRTSQQLQMKSSRAKTCPQLRGTTTGTATMRGKGSGSQNYSLRSLRDMFAPDRHVRRTSVSCPKKTPSSSSQSMCLLPERYRQEKCAYFAEVDAFELLEEEADEEEVLEDTEKQKDTVE